jgi:hypothetical protein
MDRVEVDQPRLQVEDDAIFGPAADHMQWNASEGVMDMTENRYDPPSCECEEYMDWSANDGTFHWGEDDGGLGWGGADTNTKSHPVVSPQAVSPIAKPSFSEENDPVASGSPIEVQVPSFAMPPGAATMPSSSAGHQKQSSDSNGAARRFQRRLEAGLTSVELVFKSTRSHQRHSPDKWCLCSKPILAFCFSCPGWSDAKAG